MPEKIERVAVYARVSTEDQAAEGYSLGAQIEKLRDYAEAEGWKIQGEYVDDGYSGRNSKRPEYERMMANIDKWDAIAVVKMDRIHRNSRNFMEMMDFLRKHNKEFVSSMELLDTSNALGRFVVDMIQRLAQLESEQIGERTYTGMREKAQSSGSGTMGFTPPFGYALENGELVTNEDEFETVKEIFAMYLSGMTVDEICYSMNKRRVFTRKDNIWNKYNLRNILHNPVYAGKMRWDDLLIGHKAPRAVTEEEFAKVQDIMRSRTRTPNASNTPRAADAASTPRATNVADAYQGAATGTANALSATSENAL